MWATFLGLVQPPTWVKVLLCYSEEIDHLYIQDALAKRIQMYMSNFSNHSSIYLVCHMV